MVLFKFIAVLGFAIILPTALAIPATITQAVKANPSIEIIQSADETAIAHRPQTVAASLVDKGPDLMTITVSNHHSTDVSTAHAVAQTALDHGWTEVGGMATPGVMTRGQTAEFAVPTGWEGHVAVVEYGNGRGVVGDESLIEANYDVPATGGFTVAVADVDVSYLSVIRRGSRL